MFHSIATLVGLAIVPVLVIFAWRDWLKRARIELPAWRNGLGVSSLVLVSIDWLAAAVLEVPVLINGQAARPADLMDGMLTFSHPICLFVIVLAFALRRRSRIELILAGLLMLLSWPSGYV